ncbi:phage tail length tape measure family protein [Bradyrhizobium elkanii]|uniref:phage tail length tape measure family protein n=1 Tax=Bradyrhizobium elkanii TaxID=29448 RepID=UPI00272A67EB|nr:phage tail length tape measure family protein [Bradyrhizobium elkanii]WLA80279.1 phage tail length tape measure family protein [Bradyrhizobium elkanii]
MKESDLVRTVTIRHKSEGADQVKSDLKGLASAQDQLAQSSQNLATVTETSAKRQASQLTQFERMERAQNQAAKALNDFNNARTVANNVLGNPAVSDTRVVDFLQTYVNRLDAATAAQNRLAQAKNPFSSINIDERMGIGTSAAGSAEASANAFLSEFGGLEGIARAKAMEAGQAFAASLDESLISGIAKSAKDSMSVFEEEFNRLDTIAQQKAQQIGGNFQKSLNESFGIGATPKSASASASVFADAADAQDRMAASAKKLQAAINPLEAEQARLAAELSDYKKALDAGYISTDHYSAAQTMAGKRLGDFAQNLKTAGTAGRVMSGELANLGFQLNDVVTGLALGQSIPMIVAQQGGQVVQIFQTSKASIGELASSAVSSFSSIFTAGRLAFGGIATAVGAVVYANTSYIQSQREVTQSLIGIGAKTQTTAGQINDFAKANASATGLSVDQARNVAVEFTKTGNIAVAGIKGVGDAIHGFSILTGQSVDDASKAFAKAFSGDVVSGAEELNKTYGFLNATTRDYIRTLELQGDRSGAIQVVLDGIRKDSEAAANSVGLLSKAYDYLANAASRAKNAVGASTAPQSNEDQLAALEKQKAALEAQQNASSQKSTLGQVHDFINPSNLITSPLSAIQDILPPSLGNVNKSIDALKEKIAGVKADAITKQFADWSKAADDVTRATIPQIAQLEALQKAEMALLLGRNLNDPKADAALTANRNQQASINESMAQTERYNQRVKEISSSWGDVGQSTALALQSAQNQLPVLEAVGGAAKIAAQATADYKNYLDQGKTASEALALAASNEAAARAQVNSAAREQLAALEDQAAVAQARTPIEAAQAQAQATFNSLLRQGVDEQLAMNIAAQQESNARDQIYTQMQKAVQASRDQVDLAATQGTADQAGVKAKIAYRQAIDAGADSTQAAIIANNAGTVAAMQWADQAQKIAEAYENAARAAQDAQYVDAGDPLGYFQLKSGVEGNTAYAIGNLGQLDVLQRLGLIYGRQNDATDIPLPFTQITNTYAKLAQQGRDAGNITSAINYDQVISSAYSAGGIDAAIKAAQSTAGTNPNALQDIDQLYEFKNSQTTDTAAQAANLRDELAWLNSQPVSLNRDQAIAQLNQSIKQLTDSTDSLNKTNQAALSPYYDQDPRTSHIGFRSQGMATGGEFTVPGGYSANDNMLAQIPVASGEIVSVRRPGQNLGGSSNNITINLGGITVNAGAGQVDANAIGRTAYQALQSGARQIAAASR